jgi:hypothetical protein
MEDTLDRLGQTIKNALGASITGHAVARVAPCCSHVNETSAMKGSVRRLRAAGRPFGLPV